MTGNSQANPDLVDVVIRHPRERLSKCSLEPLRSRADIRFLTFGPGFSFDASGYILLQVEAPVLSREDGHLPLLLLDSTWRLLPSLLGGLTGRPLARSLPPAIRTAYPRKSKVDVDPARGLASVEALFSARRLQGRPHDSLLEAYYWKDSFLEQFKT